MFAQSDGGKMNAQPITADIKGIMEIIPHRPPFLLIDRIISSVPGRNAVAEKGVTMNEPFFAGHFPGHPVMPGVLIVEAMAQAGAFSILSIPENKGRLAFFGAADKVRFRQQVTPGGMLRLEVEIVKLRPAAGVGRGVAYFDGNKAAEAELTFFLG
ncbi:MAG: 3-hydroxyacyl-ACP dehydratase FabZ [Defluviitaleaceae bacterium]|nr:3-hydroxyacyl-ACP dehydratase FabZ [Defluviitaleaceae bacterium]MCL2837262.1 3-hydroxyacyl-ACP dehydratase FabZ [Defluviitaleaceae bacterium]